MPISAEMKTFVAGLGDDEVWKKLGTDLEPDYVFIYERVEQAMNLVATVRSDKAGGLTGHMGLIMPAAEFALLPGFTVPFPKEVHPGAVNYTTAPAATTIVQQQDRRYEHQNKLHVFEMEQMIETKIKKHIMSCFDEDIYVELKHHRLGYSNVTVEALVQHLYDEYGEKTEELQNKALKALEEDYDMTTNNVKLLRIRQEKWKLFLANTEQAINDGTYIKKTLGVIEKSNYLNKDVLKWRRKPLAERTIINFWPFFKDAHKKQKLKLLQGGDDMANSVMQNKMENYALQIMQLQKYTDDQQVALNSLIDREAQSRSGSIPGVIETTTSPSSIGDTTEMTTAQALIASLRSELSVAQRQRYDPNRNRGGPGPGRGGDNTDQGRGRGGERRPQNVLGTVDNDADRRLTRREDPNRLKKKFKNKNYCHTHGYECSKDHDSSHCMWPEKGHKQCATAENPMGGCLLYKRLYTAYCLECPG